MDRTLAKRITGLILATGLVASVGTFIFAETSNSFPLGYDPLTNKKYILELQRYGGRANVASAEFLQWFEGLWHGRPLAYTIAVLTCIIAAGFWIVATLPPLDDSGGPQNGGG